MAAINSSGYGGPRLFYSPNIGEVSVDEFTLRRTTHRNCSTRPVENRPRGHYGHATWNPQKRNFGHAPNSFGPFSFAFLGTVSLSFLFPTVVARITSPSIGVLKFRDQQRIEGFQFWINGVSDFKLNLFIYLFVSISNNYFENRKFYSKSKRKRKIKNSNTYFFAIQLALSLSLRLSTFPNFTENPTLKSRSRPTLPRIQPPSIESDSSPRRLSSSKHFCLFETVRTRPIAFRVEQRSRVDSGWTFRESHSSKVTTRSGEHEWAASRVRQSAGGWPVDVTLCDAMLSLSLFHSFFVPLSSSLRLCLAALLTRETEYNRVASSRARKGTNVFSSGLLFAIDDRDSIPRRSV